jgi:hypothetical protein
MSVSEHPNLDTVQGTDSQKAVNETLKIILYVMLHTAFGAGVQSCCYYCTWWYCLSC